MPGAESSKERRSGREVEARLGELESRFEFHMRTMEELDTVVKEFAERVSRLERELKELRIQLEQLSDDDDAGDEPADAAASQALEDPA